MAESNYGKYFITECTNLNAGRMSSEATPNFDMYKIKDLFPEAQVTGNGVCFFKPCIMVKSIHIHDYDEYLYFLGMNYADMNDFDAEVELHMGDEGEVHVIKSPTIVYIPKGLKHCPLKFVKINKPVFFFHIRDHSLERK